VGAGCGGFLVQEGLQAECQLLCELPRGDAGEQEGTGS
jgi:hypothetical protein